MHGCSGVPASKQGRPACSGPRVPRLQEGDAKDDTKAIKFEEKITELAYDKWDSTILAQYVSNAGAIDRESGKPCAPAV